MKHAVMSNSLGSRYKLVGVIPISQQVGGLLVVNTDVVVLKHTGEEVVNLPRYIQDVLNPEGESDRNENIVKMIVDDIILHGFIDFSTVCPVSPSLPALLQLLQIGCIPLRSLWETKAKVRLVQSLELSFS